jgi:hypothetical protein
VKTDSGITLRALLISLVCLYIFVTLVGSYTISSNPIFDETTLLLCTGLGVLFLIALSTAKGHLLTEFAAMALFFLVFVFPRLVVYVFAPDTVVWPFGDNIDAHIVNKGLSYILAGTVFLLLGMGAANAIFRGLLPPETAAGGDPFRWSSRRLVILALLSITFQLFVTFVLKISHYGAMQAESFNTFLQFFRVSFEMDSAYFFTVGALLFMHLRRKDPVGKGCIPAIAIVSLCYLITTAAGGSRVGVVRVLMLFFLVSLLVQDDLRLKAKKIFRIILILGAMGMVLYPLGTMRRIFMKAEVYGQNYGVAESQAQDYALEETSDLRSVGGIIVAALDRLGKMIDYPILIITQEGNQIAKEKYMNFLYPLKNIINILLPGTPFPEAEIMTSRTVDIIYRGGDEPDMYERYFSEYWTLWGLAYVYFGTGGGLLFLFVAGFLLHAFYCVILLSTRGMLQFCLRLWYLFFVNYGALASMGIDSSITTNALSLIAFINFYILMGLPKPSLLFWGRRPSLMEAKPSSFLGFTEDH